ncbi:toll-like receptor 5 isoform X2 [Ambystoma mexicanum]
MLHRFTILFGAALVTSTQSQYPFCASVNKIAFYLSCNLTYIPLVPEDTETFSLSLNYILEVNATSFPPLEKLLELDIGSQRTNRLIVRKDAFRNLPNLLLLDLGGNIILLLDPSAFTGLLSLKKLALYYNHLDGSILENDYFRDLMSLQYLDLSGNQIKHLKPNPLFYYLHNFHTLILKLNSIATVCEGDLHSFQRKTFWLLDLSDNHLYRDYTMDSENCGNPFRNIIFNTLAVSSNGFDVSKTQNFCKAVRGTQFVQLKFNHHTMGARFGYRHIKDPDSDTFAGLGESDLKTLDLSNGFIFSLNPKVFANLSHLQQLILASNKINAIQWAAFYGLNALETLNLTYNLLGEIYDFTFDGLLNVKEIYLEHNHIGAIMDNAFQRLTKLNLVNLQDNALKSLYFCLTMPFVPYVLVGNNRLSAITDSINTSFLDLSGNRLANLGNLYVLLSSEDTLVTHIIMRQNHFSYCYKWHTVQNSNRLEYLDLGSNFLQLVWNSGACLDVFRALSMLQVLHLDNNYLRALPEDIFVGLTSLVRLNLSSNSLMYLPNHIFPEGLATVDLSRNQLIAPEPSLFNSLSRLDITNNRFVCDCSLVSLILWLNNTNVTLLGSRNDIYCVFPSTMQEVPLHKIVTDDCEADNLEHLMLSLFLFTLVTLIIFITSVIIYTHFRGYTFVLYKSIVDFLLIDQKQEVEDADASRYDAYFCYSSKDFEWVQNALLKNLDSQYCERNRFKVCFEERDFVPGEDHIINIRDAIWNSKKTICIVTKHFLRDGWCVEAFNFAQSRSYTELKDVLIMVVVGAISQYQLVKFKPIRAFVQRRQYLRWPEDLQDVDWFLNSLSKKILKEQVVEKKKPNPPKEMNTLELQNIATIS